MKENEMLYCLIAFILGWFVSRHMGNGFNVGGINPPPWRPVNPPVDPNAATKYRLKPCLTTNNFPNNASCQCPQGESIVEDPFMGMAKCIIRNDGISLQGKKEGNDKSGIKGMGCNNDWCKHYDQYKCLRLVGCTWDPTNKLCGCVPYTPPGETTTYCGLEWGSGAGSYGGGSGLCQLNQYECIRKGASGQQKCVKTPGVVDPITGHWKGCCSGSGPNACDGCFNIDSIPANCPDVNPKTCS